MKLTLVLRDKKNALKLSTKTIESFIERIKTDTKSRTVGRRREQFRYTESIESYDRQFPSHLIYPSAEFEKDENDNRPNKISFFIKPVRRDGKWYLTMGDTMVNPNPSHIKH